MIRRWAVRILQTAIRRAPAERQEWGRAMLREIDFVNSDWATLWWAIGSARSIARLGDRPIRGLDDVAPAIHALRKTTRTRNLSGYVVCIMVIAAFASYLLVLRTWMQQLGSTLTIAGAVFMIYQLYAYRVPKVVLQETQDKATEFAFYLIQLERQRDFHSGQQFTWRLLALVPGYVFFCVGGAIALPAFGDGFVCLIVLFFLILMLAVPANLRLARKYQRRLAELNALQR